METKVCTHCGELRPLSMFRAYYGKRKGHYRYCRMCERLLMRYKYLTGKGDAVTQEESEELAKLKKLYEYRHAAGLETPGKGRNIHGATAAIVDKLLEEFESGDSHENM